jgi:hypothetical protein
LIFIHLVGLAFGVGAATVKVALLIRCKYDFSLIPFYLKVAKPISQLIVLGIILLTLSGIGFVLEGYPFTTQLIIKLFFVGLIWIIGPIIDNVLEPKFRTLAPNLNEQTAQLSIGFKRIQRRYLTVEIIATLFFYTVIGIWILG